MHGITVPKLINSIITITRDKNIFENNLLTLNQLLLGNQIVAFPAVSFDAVVIMAGYWLQQLQ